MPRSSQVHEDKALERISVAYAPEGLIATAFSPMVPVKHESDKYYVYSKDNLRVPETIWADRDVPNMSTWNLSTATYSLQRHALRDIVTDRTRDNADKAVAPDVDTTEGLTHQILLRREVDLFDLINSTNFGTSASLSSTQVWTANTTLSNPITLIDSATSSIRQRSGKMANTIIMGDPAFKAAKEHSSITERVKYTSMQSVTESMLASLFNVGTVFVSRGVRNTGDEGLSDSLTDIATDTVLVCYNEKSPGLKKPSAFYTFVKEGSTTPYRVVRYRDEEREGDWIRVDNFYQHKIVSTDCAFVINNAV